MPHTLARVLIHAVFSTKERRPLIVEPEMLWKRMGLIAKSKNVALITAGGTKNHVHILLALSPMMALAKVIQDLKVQSSHWMKDDVRPFSWQEGYGAFSVSESQREAVVNYIATQGEHHQKWTYEQEYETLVRKAGLEYDPRYLFG